jgi:hypothetical protein
MTEVPYRVKFTPYRKELGKIMLRQTKDGKGLSADGRYRFYIGEEIENPDFWVVQGKGLRRSETVNVAPQNTVFLSTEPSTVLVYPQSYVRQFGLVCSCQENTRHRNIIQAHPVLPWFVGFRESPAGQCTFSLDYNMLSGSPAPGKTKLLSVITSNKAFTRGHLDRIRFVEKLNARYGNRIDVFGRGFRDFDDKWDVLAPYKYHIAIENSSQRYYWTEKISDCFLAGTFPFYGGCTNLDEYFPEQSFQPVDISDFERTVEIIDRLMANNTFEQRQSAINQSKQLVLGKYNMFNFVASLCDRLDASLPKEWVTLHKCHTMCDRHNLYHYLISRNLFKIKQNLSPTNKSIWEK